MKIIVRKIQIQDFFKLLKASHLSFLFSIRSLNVLNLFNGLHTKNNRSAPISFRTGKKAPNPFLVKGFGAFLPKLNSEWFAWFVGKIQECMGQTGMPDKVLFIANGAAEVFAKEKLVLEITPQVCPELNPIGWFLR